MADQPVEALAQMVADRSSDTDSGEEETAGPSQEGFNISSNSFNGSFSPGAVSSWNYGQPSIRC